ncbi:MAG: alpha/beta fold hydrolase [Rhodobacteraceae bacterium]|nr:alpha/beta fold hydrolase [Paracoccaceae bacterium]
MEWERYKSTWPNAETSEFISCHPHRWHVQRAGTGSPILLIHGSGASTHSWAQILPALAETHHVIALDLPGQGFTKLGTRSRCGRGAMARDILSLLISLDVDPKVVIGHSAGAAIAVTMASQMTPQPQVISINGAFRTFGGLAGVLFPAVAKILSLSPGTGRVFAQLNGSRDRVKRLIGSTGSQVPDQILACYQALVSDPGHVNATLAMMAQWSLSDMDKCLNALVEPAHFLVGAKDATVHPSASKEAARHVRNAKVETLANRGHLLHEEDPEAVIASIKTQLFGSESPDPSVPPKGSDAS